MILDSRLEQFLESILFTTFGTGVKMKNIHYVGGGCINNTLKVNTSEGDFFVKWNENEENDMFEKEIRGLKLLQNIPKANIPKTFNSGRLEGRNFLIMEFLEKHAPRADFWKALAESLTRIHLETNNSYGLDHNNFIGRLPQRNDQERDWVQFFINHRLEVQLGLGIYNGLISSSFAEKFRLLYDQLPGLLVDEPASLLHGDLWSGNFMVGPQGNPYLVDPAVYYGNREIELAFTKLFGGFDPEFYFVYNELYPLQPGFEERVEIYNLYPLLVHVNLFGTSYLSGVERTIRKYTQP